MPIPAPIALCRAHPRIAVTAVLVLVAVLDSVLRAFAPPALGGWIAVAEAGLGLGLARMLWPRAALAVRLEQIERTTQRIAAELDHYRTFTDILRRQGQMVTATTEAAATGLVEGLRAVDSGIETILADCPVGRLRHADEIEAVSRRLILMMSSIQFQDITRQQIEQMARMSEMVDQHVALAHAALADLSHQFDTASLADKLDQVFAGYVMAGQRDSHRAARGDGADREAIGAAIELF